MNRSGPPAIGKQAGCRGTEPRVIVQGSDSINDARTTTGVHRPSVTFLAASAQMGGAERVLLDLIGSLCYNDAGLRMHLILPADGPLGEHASAAGVPTTVLPLPPAIASLGESGGRLRLLATIPAVLRHARALHRALAAISPDIIHTNGFKMHALGSLAAPHGAQVVWHIHDYVTTRRLMRWVMRALSWRRGWAIANSDSVAEDVRRACGPSVNVRTIRNAVDLDRFSPIGPTADLDALAEVVPPQCGTVRVGLVATYAHWKGHDTFLRAIAALPRQVRVRAYIVGGPIYQTDGSQRSAAELRAMVERLGLGGRVVLTGPVLKVEEAYRALDIVVHASTQPEPFGLVIAEAMACGRPVVVSSAGGATELIEPGVDAIAFVPGDHLALADCIAGLASAIERRAEVGAAARDAAERRFDRRRLGGEARAVYAAMSGAR